MTVLMNESKRQITVHIEPWGEEHALGPGEKLRVTGESPQGNELEISWGEDRVTVYGNSGGTVKVEPV